MNVLIVGAGPTGLTAAVELARRGVVADIIDRKDEPSPLSRAVGILPASMAILEPSGVAAAIRAKAVTPDKAIFHFNTDRLVTFNLAASSDPKHRLFSLAQDETERSLMDAFERYGGTVRFGMALEHFEQDSDGVTVTANGEAARYDYLIGADGVRSSVRESLGIEYVGHDLPDKWSIADVDAEDWPYPDIFTVFIRPEAKNVIAIPLEPGRLRVISNTEDALALLPIDLKIRAVRRSGVFQISVRQAETYQKGRVFLAGDAAHCHSPVGGRGMNLGIADAADLAERLVDGGLDSYTDARHPEGEAVIKLSENGRKMILTNNRIKRAAVLLLLRLVDTVPALNRAAVKQLLGT